MPWGDAPNKYTGEFMSEDEKIDVEVAYALPDKQAIVTLQVLKGCTAIEAAQQSRITELFEGIDLDNAKLGIFGKQAAPGQILRAGDRVEVYRPLIADPKEVRRARAARAKEMRAKEKEG